MVIIIRINTRFEQESFSLLCLNAAPFLVTLVIMRLLITVFPSVVLFLPRLLYGLPLN